MNNLIMDIGNTNVKLFIFHQDKIIHNTVVSGDTAIKEELEILQKKYILSNCIISSVRDKFSHILLLAQSICKTIIFTPTLQVPIKNQYETPKTLGADRLAGVCGASHLYPNRNVLIIDAGTAITYDIITSANEYLGGNISPGINTRFKSLHTFTEKLPLININNRINSVFGKNTETAIILGVQNGMRHEVEGIINDFREEFEDLLVVFTGGDSFFFEKLIKNRTFVEPNLTAFGLNKILKTNV